MGSNKAKKNRNKQMSLNLQKQRQKSEYQKKQLKTASLPIQIKAQPNNKKELSSKVQSNISNEISVEQLSKNRMNFQLHPEVSVCVEPKQLEVDKLCQNCRRMLKESSRFKEQSIINNSSGNNEQDHKKEQFPLSGGDKLDHFSSVQKNSEQIQKFIKQQKSKYKSGLIHEYKLLEKPLGGGSQGVVYQAQSSLAQIFALKISQTKIRDKEGKSVAKNQQEKNKDQFRKRAAKHVSLDHPNVVKAYEFMMMGQEKYFLTVLELCEGTLSDWIGNADARAQQLMIEKIAAGVKYMHEQGVVHHDLKPGNILLKNGEPKIADFDGVVLLKVLYAQQPDSDIKKIFATTNYKAPQTFKHKFGEKADVWSMGVIFYEILSRKRIYELKDERKIDQKTSPGQIEGFFSPGILGAIKNEKLKNLVGRMLDENDERRLNSKTVELQMNKILQRKPANKIQIPLGADQRRNVKKVKENQFNELVSKNLSYNQCKYIDLTSQYITDAGLKALIENGHKFPKLQEIYLYNNQLTCEGLNGHKFPELQAIYLYDNQITDAGLKMLVGHCNKFPQLKIMDLQNNQITHEGLEAVIENSHNFLQLQNICLNNNQVKDAGLENLAVHAHKFSQLQAIDLQNN